MAEQPAPQLNNAPYKVYGTNEPYSGMTVEIGGFLYTTDGGTLQGDSLQLTANPLFEAQPTPPNQQQQNQLMGGTQGTSGTGAVNPSNQTGGGSGGPY